MKLFEDKEKINKAMVCVVTEKALLDMGKPTYEKIISTLNKKYQCYLTDCYEHPEYLCAALDELYGRGGRYIIETITRELKIFKEHKPILRFLEIINR